MDGAYYIVLLSPWGFTNNVMWKCSLRVLPSLHFKRLPEEDRPRVDVSTAYIADDDASRSRRANLQTSEILHLAGRRHYRIPDVSIKILRRASTCWIHIRVHLREC